MFNVWYMYIYIYHLYIHLYLCLYLLFMIHWYIIYFVTFQKKALKLLVYMYIIYIYIYIYIYVHIIYIYIHIYTYVHNNMSLFFHFIYLALLLWVCHLIDIIITIDKNKEVMLKLSCIKFKAKLKTESVLKDHGVVILSFSGNWTVRWNMVRNIKLILHQE